MNNRSRRLVIALLIQTGCLFYGYCPGQRLQTLDHKVYDLSKQRKKLVAFVFLSPECPLCQNYSLALNDLQEKFETDLDILGIFPGKAYDQEAYQGFRDKYHIRFPLLTDTSFGLVKQLSARVTPEVFLMDTGWKILYHGAIDNWVTALGKHRNKATEHYLEDGIGEYLRKSPILVKETKPVGCYINEY
jgi:peroxiredoxin